MWCNQVVILYWQIKDWDRIRSESSPSEMINSMECQFLCQIELLKYILFINRTVFCSNGKNILAVEVKILVFRKWMEIQLKIELAKLNTHTWRAWYIYIQMKSRCMWSLLQKFSSARYLVSRVVSRPGKLRRDEQEKYREISSRHHSGMSRN